ncbi:MAG TPA: CDP-alcohol phosphatidyltransferase family protein [Rhodocyclaceae bacterium]|jgi:phosphatidylglycerophosphate synthase
MRLFFDERFIQGFNPATRSVPLLYFLYLSAVPLAKVLIVCRIKPNSITTLSNLTAIAGLVFLVLGSSAWLFPMMWMLALFLDIADGIVARVTGQASAQGSFYDHMSDQVKVIALFLCVALRYDEHAVWIVAFAANGLFMFYGVVNQFYYARTLLLSRAAPAAVQQSVGSRQASEISNQTTERGLIKSFFDRHPFAKKCVLGVYASLFVMYGNCMILLLPVSIGWEWAMASMLLFGLVTFRSLVEVVRNTIKVNKQIAQAKISWR